ncbi:type II toxin-antitoxin system RelE/ParE family toxin [Candidatus Pacearchaeota archaeon]|nr:type II toxin-antitoxin system RelE/ParE family toxin [Candidatus Pacearchaeota archaeon]
MVIVDYDPDFQKIFSKLDKGIKIKVEKALTKIIENPEIGKPMRYARKGTREVYIPPFRLSYAYLPKENKIIILTWYHKDEQ